MNIFYLKLFLILMVEKPEFVLAHLEKIPERELKFNSLNENHERKTYIFIRLPV